MLLIENLHNTLQTKIDQLTAQVTEQLRNQNLSEAAHQQIHCEVGELRSLDSEVEPLKSAGAGSGKHAFITNMRVTLDLKEIGRT